MASIRSTFKGDSRKLERAIQNAVEPVSIEFAKKANEFVKVDTGTTRESVYQASQFKQGKVIWASKYAKYAYYRGRPNREHNPNASKQWGMVAKGRYMKHLAKLAKKSILEGL